jgi:hypothetical protein
VMADTSRLVQVMVKIKAQPQYDQHFSGVTVISDHTSCRQPGTMGSGGCCYGEIIF